MIRALAMLVLALVATPALAETAPDTGRFVEIPAATSTQPEIAAPHIVVWLPPGYDASRRRYAVVYMHDGQNVFFPERSAFHKVWGADKAALRLIAAKRVAPFIIVAIDNPLGARYRQYFPQGIYDIAPADVRAVFDKSAGGPITGDAYLRFLVRDLKPMIDRTYRTLPDAAHTAMVGSSMGGLITCYAFVRYPTVFGRAGCVSTHWLLTMPTELPPHADVLGLWKRFFAAHLGKPAGRKLWMDHGTKTLDANYAPWQAAIDAELVRLGWREGRDFASRTYQGAAHEENAWAARMDDIFAWLLG
ncbi:MAG: alpha/beta hydrolase [Sphingomonas sp.]|uniref:alpha/beta hydrolase n=1 Tax=Sphingomonas sp. TaxID=28214 RepID=UPI001ACF430D|nr:alpha/beta hydrolase-fold protein [Sphingomonas sp.]MBN8807882.1 alpha/beta hydrolase [Sphingomonas sp.]